MCTKVLADIYQTAGCFSISAAFNAEYLFLSLLVAKWPKSVLNQVSLCILMLYHTLLLLFCPGWGYFSLRLRASRFSPTTKQIEVAVCSLPKAQLPAGAAWGAQGEYRSDWHGHHPNCLPHNATAHKQCRVPTPPACVFVCLWPLAYASHALRHTQHPTET